MQILKVFTRTYIKFLIQLSKFRVEKIYLEFTLLRKTKKS